MIGPVVWAVGELYTQTHTHTHERYYFIYIEEHCDFVCFASFADGAVRRGF